MPHITTATPQLTATSLIDEVMGVLARGEAALFADLAQAAWSPQATLASLAGSGSLAQTAADPRDTP
jgi:hypothetical protein